MLLLFLLPDKHVSLRENHLGWVGWVLQLAVLEQPFHGRNVLPLLFIVQNMRNLACVNIFSSHTFMDTDISYT